MLLTATVAVAQVETNFIDNCGLDDPSALPLPPVEKKSFEHTITQLDEPTVMRQIGMQRIGGIPTPVFGRAGALSGKTIYLSPGHGFTWTSISGNFVWQTQRGTTNQIVEDLVSNETLSQYLIPMLQNVGAQVFSVREPDMNKNLVIVDNSDGAPAYVEAGAGFGNSSLAGWGRPTFPMTGDTLPFSMGGNRLMNANTAQTASATFTATIPEDGFYSVSIAYTQFTSRVPDAHVVVQHAGGDTHFRVNQRRHGGTWVPLGQFYFRAGTPGKVVVLNDSTAPMSTVSIDAVKFGGGMGLIQRDGNASGVSARPRYEESARYGAQFLGAPLSVFAPTSNAPASDRTNDISTRSRWAAWMHEPGEDAIYVAWHTNAFNAAAVGTNTYVYGPNPPDGTLNFTGVAGSDTLATAIHTEMINDFKATSGLNQPMWRDRGVNSASFGETNPNNNNETPAVLIEVAFHDAAFDANFLKEPNFRYIAARAIAQGIIKYFAAKDATPTKLFPEPPTRVAALNQPNNEVIIKWNAPATDTQNVRGQAAIKYRVYSSADGLGWDNGVETISTSLKMPLAAGQTRYFKITAVNDGGESFPSSIVGAKAPQVGKEFVLVVNAFERMEAAIAPTESFPASTGLGTVLRVILPRMNDGNRVRMYGKSLGDNGVGFDSCDAESVSAQSVSTLPYSAIAWFSARGKNGNANPSAAEATALRAIAQRNQPIFFSGNLPDATLLTDVLAASVSTAPANQTVSLSGFFSTFQNMTIQSDFGAGQSATPTASSMTLGTYSNASTAAIGTPTKSLYFGFPFEGISNSATQTTLMRKVLDYLAPLPFDGGILVEDAGYAGDSGTDDAGSTVLVDGGSGVDAGTPMLEDAGMNVSDSGTPMIDAGADAGIPVYDGGLSLVDGGPMMEPIKEPIVRPLLTPQQFDAPRGCGCQSSGAVWVFICAVWLMRKSHRS
jgi:hypothetical protein